MTKRGVIVHSIPFSCHCALLSLTKSSGSRSFYFYCHCEERHLRRSNLVVDFFLIIVSILSLRNLFLDEVKRPCLFFFSVIARRHSFYFSCHCALLSLTKSSGSRSFYFSCHCEGAHLFFATEAISLLMLFGWSIEEGLFTSSNWKGETASSLHFVSFRSLS